MRRARKPLLTARFRAASMYLEPDPRLVVAEHAPPVRQPFDELQPEAPDALLTMGFGDIEALSAVGDLAPYFLRRRGCDPLDRRIGPAVAVPDRVRDELADEQSDVAAGLA